MIDINYSHPRTDLSDLQARLMLAGVAVSDWQPATVYQVMGLHAGYQVSFDEVEADSVQWFSALGAFVDVQSLNDLDGYSEVDRARDEKTYENSNLLRLREPAPSVAPIEQPDESSQILCYLVTRNARGQTIIEVTVDFMMQSSDGNGNAYHRVTSEKSGPGGLLQLPLVRGARYKMQGPSAATLAVEFTVPTSGESYELPDVIVS